MRPEQHYVDDYFARGHWGRTIWQTVWTLLAWLLFLVPGVITGAMALAALTKGRWGHYFWHYHEGFVELKFLVVFLPFMFGVMAVFCLSSAYLQNRRRQGLVEKWPMLNPLKRQRQQHYLEAKMALRFGPATQRHRARVYRVQPNQNLTNQQLADWLREVENDFTIHE
ncbi:ABC transporter permease [Limosilactobacillus ingluviei]|uniref:ABC transporter permease n=1 Tax=Limosilactobacillus ingluviei TaxID=148604 RepID=UPI0023F52B17|nr:ABC transporter permease [Limosilactobacillus ingluviei]